MTRRDFLRDFAFKFIIEGILKGIFYWRNITKGFSKGFFYWRSITKVVSKVDVTLAWTA